MLHASCSAHAVMLWEIGLLVSILCHHYRPQKSVSQTGLSDIQIYPYMYGFFGCTRIFTKIPILGGKMRVFDIFWEFNLIYAKSSFISKNGSNKSCLKLNFLQKTPFMRISISPISGARGFKHLLFLDDAIEWKSRFTLGWNVFESTDYIKKYFNRKSSKIKFPTKTSLGGRICQSLPVEALGASKDLPFLKYNTLV